jgi:hypothetical protein
VNGAAQMEGLLIKAVDRSKNHQQIAGIGRPQLTNDDCRW